MRRGVHTTHTHRLHARSFAAQGSAGGGEGQGNAHRLLLHGTQTLDPSQASGVVDGAFTRIYTVVERMPTGSLRTLRTDDFFLIAHRAAEGGRTGEEFQLCPSWREIQLRWRRAGGEDGARWQRGQSYCRSVHVAPWARTRDEMLPWDGDGGKHIASPPSRGGWCVELLCPPPPPPPNVHVRGLEPLRVGARARGGAGVGNLGSTTMRGAIPISHASTSAQTI
ncbi:hypothetical protein F4825DRAFT_448509 [Nemania diffusa]|nr:hypothetical protein F4825DRAFT_448509 [Nemania diffusa]